MNLQIAITDDHQLFVQSLTLLVNTIPGCEVILQATNGKDLITRLEHAPVLPNILLLDVNMPVMDGPEAARYINQNFAAVRIIALSMNDEDNAVISMLRAAAVHTC